MKRILSQSIRNPIDNLYLLLYFCWFDLSLEMFIISTYIDTINSFIFLNYLFTGHLLCFFWKFYLKIMNNLKKLHKQL